jgi:hypothetical protein
MKRSRAFVRGGRGGRGRTHPTGRDHPLAVRVRDDASASLRPPAKLGRAQREFHASCKQCHIRRNTQKPLCHGQAQDGLAKGERDPQRARNTAAAASMVVEATNGRCAVVLADADSREREMPHRALVEVIPCADRDRATRTSSKTRFLIQKLKGREKSFVGIRC